MNVIVIRRVKILIPISFCFFSYMSNAQESDKTMYLSFEIFGEDEISLNYKRH
jgi:hypothetical protein